MSRSASRLLLPLLACLVNASHAVPYFYGIWQIGNDDETPNEFGGATWTSNASPGSPLLRDDDFYRAATYPGFGTVADEPLVNFEGSVTGGDPRNRIHFPLTAPQASAGARLKLTIDLIWGGSSTPGFSNHQLTLTMNGQPVGTFSNLTWNRTLEVVFPAASVNAVAGPNVIQIERTGGTAGGWISFDYLKLDHDPTGMQDADSDGLPRWYEETFGLSESAPSDAASDRDGDGRSALVEMQAGTNPTDADTDNDGLSDSAELTPGTHPLLRDTDDDGISDGDETLTSPLLADTDGDGHPDNIEFEQGSLPNSAASVPFDFPGAIGLQFVSEALQSAALPAGDPAGLFRLPKWNTSPPLPQWQSDGIVLNGSMALKNHRGQTSSAAASWSYHFADEGLHKGISNERLFNGMIRTQRTGTVNSNGVVTVLHNTPVILSLTGIPYPTYDLIVYAGYV